MRRGPALLATAVLASACAASSPSGSAGVVGASAAPAQAASVSETAKPSSAVECGDLSAASCARAVSQAQLTTEHVPSARPIAVRRPTASHPCPHTRVGPGVDVRCDVMVTFTSDTGSFDVPLFDNGGGEHWYPIAFIR